MPELLDGVRLARTLVIADRAMMRTACARREPMAHDEVAYRARNCVERLVSKLKQFRRIATRYDQTAASFLALVELAALRICAKYLHAP